MTTTIHRRALQAFAAAAIAVPILAGTGLSFAQGKPAPAAPAPGLATSAPAPSAAPTTDISALRDMNRIAIKGRVAEIFGNKFIVEDASGRALVDTGPSGDAVPLVTAGETVGVEGRFERGTFRAVSLTREDGRRVEMREPRGPGRDGPGMDGPRVGPHGKHHGGPGERGGKGEGPRAEKRDGGGVLGWFSGGVDEATAKAALTGAGYTDVTLVDTGPRHAEFQAKDAAGSAWSVKVNENGQLTEREPFRPRMSEDQARAAVAKLGYAEGGDVELRRDHVDVEAKTAAGRSVVVEINADGSLRKERFAD